MRIFRYALAIASFMLLGSLMPHLSFSKPIEPFNNNKVVELTPKCELGDAQACLDIAAMLADDYGVGMSEKEAKTVLPVVIQGCGIPRHDNSDEAMKACLWVGEAYSALKDYHNSVNYFQYSCDNGFTKGCGRVKSLNRERAEEARLDQREKEWAIKRAEEKEEDNRKLFNIVMKGLVDVAIVASGGDKSALKSLNSGEDSNSAAGAGTTVSAGSIPTGSYSSWSQAERDQAGPALGKMCESECASYKNACKAGGQRPCYEAAACTTACFVNNLPDDYPQLEAFKKSARENYNNAKKLGSNAPVFLKGR